MSLSTVLTYGRYFLCVAILIPSSAVSAFEVLMTTPQQRLALDEGRKGLPARLLTATDIAQRPTEALALDGLVRRRKGPNTLWVNGIIVQNTSVDGVTIDANKLVDSAALLESPSTNSPVLIKPGQRYGLSSGDVSESYAESMKQMTLNKLPASNDEETLIANPTSIE